MTESGHGADGRFTVGNPGGPGRPRRAVELDYMRALSDALKIDDWRAIVERAVTDAKSGDKAAREWLSTYALGKQGPSLFDIALRDMAGISTEAEINEGVEAVYEDSKGMFPDHPTPFGTALAKRRQEQIQAQREEQARIDNEERERRKAEREARKAARGANPA